MTAPTEDWRQERARVLAQARVVVVKVGSAVLTDAQGLSMPVLENLAGQLARLRNLLPAAMSHPVTRGARSRAVWCLFLPALWPLGGPRLPRAGMWLKPRALRRVRPRQQWGRGSSCRAGTRCFLRTACPPLRCC